eukprot:11192769-Lingulodinium_polyedra.AAC.1
MPRRRNLRNPPPKSSRSSRPAIPHAPHGPSDCDWIARPPRAPLASATSCNTRPPRKRLQPAACSLSQCCHTHVGCKCKCFLSLTVCGVLRAARVLQACAI